jgi:hypothetical protein
MFFLDLSPELKTILIEEYSKQEKPHAGEIFCKIRYYHLNEDLWVDCRWFEKRWWALLSDHASEKLKQFFRHDDLTSVCDELRDITGLWRGWRDSTLHQMIGMRCDEVLLVLRVLRPAHHGE